MFHKINDPFAILQLTIHVTKKWPQNYTVYIEECVNDRQQKKMLKIKFHLLVTNVGDQH